MLTPKVLSTRIIWLMLVTGKKWQRKTSTPVCFTSIQPHGIWMLDLFLSYQNNVVLSFESLDLYKHDPTFWRWLLPESFRDYIHIGSAETQTFCQRILSFPIKWRQLGRSYALCITNSYRLCLQPGAASLYFTYNHTSQNTHVQLRLLGHWIHLLFFGPAKILICFGEAVLGRVYVIIKAN